MSGSLEERVKRAVSEKIEIVPYNTEWPALFKEEKERLLKLFPVDLSGLIVHFGSTAVPGLSAKPVIDMLVEIFSFEKTKKHIVPILEKNGYDYFWRPILGDGPPFYPWFIRRNSEGVRTHHIHMAEPGFPLWDQVGFKDILIAHPETAKAYETLKISLAAQFPNDRAAYTHGKSVFIKNIMDKIRQ